MNPLTDEDIMPFGKYNKMSVKMKDVPASYLHWLWHNGKKYELGCPVRYYIKEMIPILEKENPDLIWED